MEEPMEESAPEPQPSEQDDKKNKVSSILRPGSMVMMTITVEDYETQYWPKLENAINQLLTMTPGEYIPISYEQMYSCVYKCVCKQFSERLYADLLRQITAHLERLCLELQASFYGPSTTFNTLCDKFRDRASTIPGMPTNTGTTTHDSCKYIESFNYAMDQYLTALGGIVPIFNYMNRFYVESKLRTDLNVELRKLFVTIVADKHVPMLIPLLVEANSKPFSVLPPIMASLIKNLYTLKPEFAALRPQLFAKFIPNILPPCNEADIDKYIEEAKQMQRDLLTHPDFISGDTARKRPGEDDPPKSNPLCFLPKT